MIFEDSRSFSYKGKSLESLSRHMGIFILGVVIGPTPKRPSMCTPSPIPSVDDGWDL